LLEQSSTRLNNYYFPSAALRIKKRRELKKYPASPIDFKVHPTATEIGEKIADKVTRRLRGTLQGIFMPVGIVGTQKSISGTKSN
jgi:hypothetical protein